MDNYSQLLLLVHVGQLVFVIVVNTFKSLHQYFFFMFHMSLGSQRPFHFYSCSGGQGQLLSQKLSNIESCVFTINDINAVVLLECSPS